MQAVRSIKPGVAPKSSKENDTFYLSHIKKNQQIVPDSKWWSQCTLPSSQYYWMTNCKLLIWWLPLPFLEQSLFKDASSSRFWQLVPPHHNTWLCEQCHMENWYSLGGNAASITIIQCGYTLIFSWKLIPLPTLQVDIQDSNLLSIVAADGLAP